MNRKILILIFSILFLYPLYIYAMGSQPPRKLVPLRVLVLKDAKSVTLDIRGSYKMVDFGAEDILRQGRNLRKLNISVGDIDSEGIKILPEARARIYINNRQFRGNIDIVKNNGKLLVINHIDLEEYLYGVLYHEVSHRWPIEVLKAQAIAARTYALYQKLISENQYYDLTSDIYSQVYGGRTSETWRTNRAVNLTQGLILTYDGKVFPSYYHATCGGSTSKASTLWNIDIPALGRRKCDFCRASPHYEWKKQLSMDDIQKKLHGAGHKIELVSIKILARDEAGRILDIVLKGKDSEVKLTGNKFRLILDPNIIRSTNFNIEMQGRYVTFEGRGWGHGIGMCQWGAFGMARHGWAAKDILRHYYHGSEIVPMRNLFPAQSGTCFQLKAEPVSRLAWKQVPL